MESFWSFYRERRAKKRLRRRVFFLCAFLIAALPMLTWKAFDPPVLALEDGPPPQAKIVEKPLLIPEPDLVFTWTIVAGDTLCAIFEKHGISHGTMSQVLSADEPLLALDVLNPGHVLTFTLDRETGELKSMELFIHPGKRVVYSRVDDAGFSYDEIDLPGEWKAELIDGDITSSFYLSALNAALTDPETANITDLFRDQIQFARDMRAGDHFQVIRSRQFVNGEFTGQSRIEGIRIFRGKRVYSAFLFDDGNYYDHEGKSLARAFRRYPMKGSCRVTSRFNPKRRHPVTHRVTPHNGVDFAMAPGTPVLSAGDGVVTRVHNHPFAGRYVEVQHGSQYATRYLHLSRILVKRGQAVDRGQRIALSGSTGRTTGPHLHYELHINGRPVNPLTARIPTATAVPREKLAAFKDRVGELTAMMDKSSLKIALHRGDDRL